jgi:hypothetical protein
MQPTTQHQEDAANRKFQAQRTLEPEALSSNWLRNHRAQAAAATQREAARQHAIGPTGREDERQGAAHFYTR